MKRIILLISLIFTTCLFSQTQIGQDIEGEAANDKSGYSISLSADGSILAIGARNNGGNGLNSGHVRVYQNESGNWLQIGQDIDGENVGDNFGQSVSISANGQVLAISAQFNDGNGSPSSNIGHVRVFEFISNNWIQIGVDIEGEAILDQSGYSISLSNDGNLIAIGARFNDGNSGDSGHVRVYENQSGNWIQVGQDIDGEASGDQSGYAISLSSNGSFVAVGAPFNDGNSGDSGHVRVYENQSGNWIQVGQDIDGEAEADGFGSSVSLSSDGSILAIGAPSNDGNGNISGHVRVFENVNDVWVQIGQDIDGEDSTNQSGVAVSLSSDGSIVAIGAINNSDNGANSGHVRIYKNQNGTWNQIGNDIDGESGSDLSGFSVSLSSDGSIVAIGAINNDGNGSNSGHVRVFDLSAVLSSDSFNLDLYKIITDNNLQELQITLNPNTILKQVNLYTIDGKYLYSLNQNVISTNNLSSGVYIVEVETNKGKSAKKVVVN
ncbi:putative secreted protein (Por secretion system target) [Winogradskyella wandonensis]|uniref:Putative secreted protein (Por secretion system target) n=1 Tax=Winogradskyella wandonensis TaxID=1442586 RepID=A0A4V2PTU0_9FLAO|nr:T9SS type A sorting domain-containing protein [Winogradskyella wandonensis]TCK67851.1 putative secreted protein (Por secretion system target) [Winogradskyella wandonensis]